MQAVTEHDSVKAEPMPSVAFDDFGDNALMFEAFFWCDASGEKTLREVRSDIRFRLDEMFAAEDIVIAFPQRDIHLDTSKPLELRMLESGS